MDTIHDIIFLFLPSGTLFVNSFPSLVKYSTGILVLTKTVKIQIIKFTILIN